jgi:hypothetical protein
MVNKQALAIPKQNWHSIPVNPSLAYAIRYALRL